MVTTIYAGREGFTEGEAYRRFNEIFDHEILCLELDYNLGRLFRKEIKRHLNQKQAVFDRMMEKHPATLADNARRAEARRLEKEWRERRAAEKEARDKRRLQKSLQRLAKGWGATLESA